MHLYPKERLAVCTTRQVNADRLERFILENLKRVSRDEPYIENLCFRLNHNPDELVRNSLIKNRVAGDRWNSRERKYGSPKMAQEELTSISILSLNPALSLIENSIETEK